MAELLTRHVAVALMYTGVVPVLITFYLLYDERQKPGVLWFLAIMATAGAWAFLYATFTLVQSPTLTLALANVFWVTVPTVAVFLFLLAYEYVFRTVASRRTVLLLLAPVVVLFLLSWTNPRNLVFTPEYRVGADGVLHVPPLGGPVKILITKVYGFLLTLFAAGMFAGEALRSTGIRRRQTVYLLLIFVAIAATTLLKIGEFVPEYFDPTSAAYTVSGLVFAFSIERHGLLKYTPAARERAFEAVDEAILVVDPDDVIVDINRSGHQLFGEGVLGTPLETALPASSTGSDHETTSTVQLGGSNGPRYFSRRTSHITYGRGLVGKLVVLSDITALKQRRDELDLLKQILTRIFRHNMRNDLNIIEGYASRIPDEGDDDLAEIADVIQDRTRQLLETSEKAKELETLFLSHEPVQVSLRDEIDRVLGPYRNRSDVVIESSVDDVTVTVHPQFTFALEEVIENAITHSASPDPPKVVVSTTVTASRVSLVIADNGPGIPNAELEALDANEETSLRHSSGIGLWLVKLIVSRLDGELDIHSGPDGTRIEIHLTRSDTPGSSS